MLHHRMRRAASALIAPGDGGAGSVVFNGSAEYAFDGEGDTNDHAIPMPTTSAGDLLVVFFATFSSRYTNITPPSGWTTIDTKDYFVCGLYVKTAGSSEPSTYTFNVSREVPLVAISAAFTGVTGYTSATWANSRTTNSVTLPSAGQVIAFFYSSFFAGTPSTPAGMTQVPTGTIIDEENNNIGSAYYSSEPAGVVAGKTNTGYSEAASQYVDSVMIGVY